MTLASISEQPAALQGTSRRGLSSGQVVQQVQLAACDCVPVPDLALPGHGILQSCAAEGIC